jgi:HAE1 family hydrophobic/amphiphilic exporter-1
VLVLFLRDARYPIAISLAIPISVISSFALLHVAGVSLNIMSLGGLALGIGMLVDNSIVVIENVFRHREKGLKAAAAAALGTEEVQRAITASTLTTVAVFGPIVYVEGVAGELFAALSFAVAFSLLASLVVAIALLPMMASRWDAVDEPRKGPGARVMRALNRGANSRPLRAFDRAWERFARWYERTLALAMQHRGRVVAAAVLMLVLTVPFALDLERSVLPQVDQGEFRALIELPRGTPLEATAQMAESLERTLLGDPAVDAVFARIGKQAALAGIEEETSGLHTALLEVRLKRGEATAPVLERLRARLGAFPPGSIALETGHATALGKLLGAGEADLAVRVRGDDLDLALAYAHDIRTRLARAASLTNVRVGTELGQPEFLLEIDRERAAAYGLEATQVAATVENHMRGRLATQFVDFDRKIDVMVRLPESARHSLETLQTLRVNDVPLSELVRVRESVGPVEIQRIGQSRIVPVYADVRQGGVDEAVAAVREVVDAAPPPADLRVDVGGENEEMRRSFRDLGLAFALAVLLVYMILAAEFESLIHPFTVLLSVPLALIGAVLSLWLFGSGINVVSLIGIVILVGIVDNDAVVKIDFINQMRREGMRTREAILAAGHARLRPIVMNTITTMLGVLPMMLGLGTGAALQAPLAVAIFGGLFTATALTLIVIPVVYELIDDARDWIAARTGRRADAPGAAPSFETAQPRAPEPAAGD